MNRLNRFFDQQGLLLKISMGILFAGGVLLALLFYARLVMNRTLTRERVELARLEFQKWDTTVRDEQAKAEASTLRFAKILTTRSEVADNARSAELLRSLIHQGPDGVWRSAKATFPPEFEAGILLLNPAAIQDDVTAARLMQMKRITESFGNGASCGKVRATWAVLAGEGETLFCPANKAASEREGPATSHRCQYADLTQPEKNPGGRPVWTQPYLMADGGQWAVSVMTPFFHNGKWVGAVGHDLVIAEMSNGDTPGFTVAGGSFMIVRTDGSVVYAKLAENLKTAGPIRTLADLATPCLRHNVELALAGLKTTPTPRLFTFTPTSPADTEYHIIGSNNPKTGWIGMTILPRESISQANSMADKVFEQLKTSVTIGFALLLALSTVFIFRYNINQARTRNSLRRRLELQQLVSNISGRLLNLSVAKIDETTTQSLGNLSLVLGIDRIVLYQLSHDEPPSLVPFSSWTATAAAMPPLQNVSLENWPWLTHNIEEMKSVAYAKPTDLPDAAVRERTDWSAAGLRSGFLVPVRGNRTKALFWFQSASRTVFWPEEDMAMAKLACEIMVTALDYKMAETAVRQNHERFRVALQDGPVSVFSQDTDLQYTWSYNPPGWMTSVAVFGHTDEEVYPPDVAERLIEAKTKAMTTGAAQRLEITVAVSPEKRATYDVMIEPMCGLDGKVTGVTSAVMDISSVKRAAEERIILEDGLREAQKLESLAVMAGGIAHDFNNLLMVVLGNAELAERSLPNNCSKDVQESLAAIIKAGQRATELSRMMLVYSGHSVISPRPLSLHETIKDISSIVDVMVPPNITVEYRLNGESALAELDKGQIQQTAIQLVQNAMEAIGTRPGDIRVSTGCRMMTAEDFQGASFGTDRTKGFYAYIEVEDTGCGMDEASRRHMFEPFFSTKFTGRGLGLATVLGITRAHGGAITVHSRPGVGTTITVYYPAKQKETPPPAKKSIDEAAIISAEATLAAAPRGAPGLNGKRGTILVVDDEEHIRHLVQTVMERAGYAVLEAENGVAGLAKFHKNAEAVSAVILDLKMPHMDGYEVMRELHMRRPDLPVIIFTGYDESEAGGRFAPGEVAAFIQKPCDVDKILQTVKEVIARPSPTDRVWIE